jgi:hypothetical protein
LLVENQPAWQANDPCLDTFRLELGSSFKGDADFTTGADNGQVFIDLLMQDVTTTNSPLDRGSFQVRKVLTREREDGWVLL